MNTQRIKKLASALYVQVLIGITAGVLLGHFYPNIGVELKPLGDLFIKLIRMVLAPIIFASVVVGIARMGSIKETGRVGAKAMVYFEICSTLALVLGMVVVNLVKPGVGMNVSAGIAFTIAKYGIGTLASYGQLMMAVYATCALFVIVVLGTVMRVCGVSLWGFLKYIKDELLIVLGTASTEAVLPQMLMKMEAMGCQKQVVGLVLPTGYTFNADGTAI
eukprot:gene48693-biopygen19415